MNLSPLFMGCDNTGGDIYLYTKIQQQDNSKKNNIVVQNSINNTLNTSVVVMPITHQTIKHSSSVLFTFKKGVPYYALNMCFKHHELNLSNSLRFASYSKGNQQFSVQNKINLKTNSLFLKSILKKETNIVYVKDLIKQINTNTTACSLNSKVIQKKNLQISQDIKHVNTSKNNHFIDANIKKETHNNNIIANIKHNNIVLDGTISDKLVSIECGSDFIPINLERGWSSFVFPVLENNQGKQLKIKDFMEVISKKLNKPLYELFELACFVKGDVEYNFVVTEDFMSDPNSNSNFALGTIKDGKMVPIGFLIKTKQKISITLNKKEI